MSEEPANKRCRLESPNTVSLAAATAAPLANIAALPDAVLQHSFSFIGKGHYRYIAGTSHRFQEMYSNEHEKKTEWADAAASIARAELCLQDAREKEDVEDAVALKNISLKAATKGYVNILEWARTKGCEYTTRHFCHAASKGHVDVLKWAEEKHLEWYSEGALAIAARNGNVHVFEWIRSTGRTIHPNAVSAAASFGHVALLSWMKEHGLLDVVLHQDSFWGGTTGNEAVILFGILGNHRQVLTWARENGIEWDEVTCGYAALDGNLPLLQWLRENGCPWDAKVILFAHTNGHENIVEWATANGCPVE